MASLFKAARTDIGPGPREGRRKPANELLPVAGAKFSSDRTDINVLRVLKSCS
jgi:hypothetical protein